MELGNLKKLTSRKFRNSWFKRFIEVLEFGPDPKIDRSIELKRKNLKTLIWLDDLRDPADKRMDWLAYSPVGRAVEVIWVKDYYQFINWIIDNGLPDGICFDHDLGEDTPTGYDCAKWLVNYCLDKKVSPPLWSSQSANPVGKANINRLLKNFVRSLDKN